MLVISFAVSMGVTADDAKTKTKFEPGFVSIFDGKTLKGWTVMPAEAENAWSAHDGMIQLQLHDPGMVVHFKNVRIKILK